MATLPPYHIRYGTCQGTAEAKSFHQYHRTRSGRCNGPGLLYIGKHCMFQRQMEPVRSLTKLNNKAGYLGKLWALHSSSVSALKIVNYG